MLLLEILLISEFGFHLQLLQLLHFPIDHFIKMPIPLAKILPLAIYFQIGPMTLTISLQSFTLFIIFVIFLLFVVILFLFLYLILIYLFFRWGELTLFVLDENYVCLS